MAHNVSILILAAGKGTRMNSKKQKILHDVGGKPMVTHLVDAASVASSQPPVLVIGMGGEAVQAVCGDRARYVVQAEQLGTGHAVMVAAPTLRGEGEQVIVTYADMPLLRAETMTQLAQQQADSGAAVVLLSVMGEPSSTFGRIVRTADGGVSEILEYANAQRRPDPDRWLNIRELNAGVYCFDARFLWDNIDALPLRQARSGHEYYLTDLIEMAVAQGRRVEALVSDDEDECLGAGTRAEMVAVERAFRNRANRRWLARGVTLVDPATTFIDQDVTIGQDTVIWPNTYLQGQTVIGDDCIIGPSVTVRDAVIGRNCHIEHAVVEQTDLTDGTRVAPFSHINGQA